MICYTLQCFNKHNFDSWFANAKAFETLKRQKHLACTICGDSRIEKAIMAPNVTVKKESKANNSPLSQKKTSAELAFTELKKKFEKISENVGDNFANEARAINEGKSPERSIHGKATINEAKSLTDEGIIITPLPWSDRKTN